MRSVKGTARLVGAGLMTMAFGSAPSAQIPDGRSYELMIHTPDPRMFLVALDEIELDWTEATPEQRLAQTSTADRPGVKGVSQQRDRTVMRVDSVRTIVDLTTVIAEQQSANPGARGRVILYEPNKPRSATTRRLLTSQVALLLDEGAVLADVLALTALPASRAVAATTGAYVLQLDDPLAAVDAARRLASTRGVKSAYPLLQRTFVTR